MRKTTITNNQADASLDHLITGDVIKAHNYDHLCQTYLIGSNIEISTNNEQKLSDSEIKLLEAVVK